MELRDYWNTVRRRWRIIAACVIVAVALAAFVEHRAQSTYTSSASVLLQATAKTPQGTYRISQQIVQQGPAYADLATGSKLAQEVSTALGGTPKPNKLQKQVTAALPATGIIEVSAKAATATGARDIAQAYAVALRELIRTLQCGKDKTSCKDAGTKVPPIRATVIDSASLPDAPDTTTPLITILAGLVLGLALGVGIAVVRELMDDSVGDSTDIARATGLSVLGQIPRDPDATSRTGASALTGHTPWAEGFRVLRTNLQYAALEKPGQVLLVTAPRKGDGATTVALNLASSFASTQQRVAVVECDLRYPSFADRLSLRAGPGLTTVLSGHAEVGAALQRVPDGLVVLPAGPVPPNPTELLSSPGMAALLDQLRQDHDVVVVDTPPTLPVADAATVAAQADGVVVVARHHQTGEDELARATDQLEAVGAQLLGVVVNLTKVDRRTRQYAEQPDPAATAGGEGGAPTPGAGQAVDRT